VSNAIVRKNKTQSQELKQIWNLNKSLAKIVWLQIIGLMFITLYDGKTEVPVNIPLAVSETIIYGQDFRIYLTFYRNRCKIRYSLLDPYPNNFKEVTT
jgi:uncharacterized membrane protein YiaA